jgi:hypothetical protein
VPGSNPGAAVGFFQGFSHSITDKAIAGSLLFHPSVPTYHLSSARFLTVPVIVAEKALEKPSILHHSFRVLTSRPTSSQFSSLAPNQFHYYLKLKQLTPSLLNLFNSMVGYMVHHI